MSSHSPDASKPPHQVQRGSRREGTLPALSQHLGSKCNKSKVTEKGHHASRGEGLAGRTLPPHPSVGTVKSASAWLSPPAPQPIPATTLAQAGSCSPLRDQGSQLTNRPASAPVHAPLSRPLVASKASALMLDDVPPLPSEFLGCRLTVLKPLCVQSVE